MKNIRLIARLDVKGEHLVKGIQLEGLRKLGSPNQFAQDYYQQGIDEIIYMDIVASLYERNSLLHIVEDATKNIFIPITVGGGIRSVEDVQAALRAGADKVAINTAAIKNPELITEISRRFGAQCTVLSIEAKKTSNGNWEAYTDNGREKTGKDVIEWAKQGYALGAGEILLTSVDREGGGKGMDVELIERVTSAVPIPVIASGGVGDEADVRDACESGNADAIAIAKALHYKDMTVSDAKAALSDTYDIRSDAA